MKHPALGLVSGSLVALVLAAGLPAGMAVAHEAGGFTESGQASWYGGEHEGRRTSSGETFDGSKLTAAHSSLPMGSYVRVTVERTGRSIVVRVNDREPPHGVRCIDLSHAAAERLGIASRGVADVSLAEVGPEEATEVAEAPEDAGSNSARRVTAPHDRPHRRRARR